MAASESLRFDIIGNDKASDAFSRVGRSASEMSAKMDAATYKSALLDDALKRQRETARRTVDATLALAKSDEILAEVEHRLRDGALEAEFALKREAEALKKVKHEADRLDGKKVKIKVDVDRSAWSRLGALFGRGGGAGGAGGGGGGGFLSALPAFSGLVNPYTIGLGAAATPFAAQAAASALIFGLGGGLAGLGIAGAFGTGKAPTQLQLTAAQDRLTAALDRLSRLQGSGKTTPGQLASAQGAVASAQDSLNKLQANAIDPAQMKMRQSFAKLTQDVQDSLVQIGKPFRPVMTSILNTATSVLDKMTPVFAGAEKTIAGPFKQFADTLLNSFSQPAVKTSIDAVAKAFGGILKTLTPQLPGMIKGIADGITNIAKAVSANPGALAAFINALFKIGEFSLNAIAWLTRVANYIEKHFKPALHRTAVIFDGVRHEIAHIWDQIFENSIGTVIRFGHDTESGFNSFRHRTAVIFDGARHDIAHTWDQVWNNTIGRAQRGVSDAVHWIGTLPGKITGIFKGAGSWLVDAGKSLVGGIVSGIKAAGSLVLSAIESLIPGPLRTVVGKILGWAGFAGGTSSAPPGWAWVGERGPELMRFRGGEQVMSAPASSAYAAARGGGRGGDIYITVNVPPTVNPRDAGRQIVDLLGAHLKAGGRIYPAGMTPR